MAPRQAEDWKTHPNLKALGLRTSLIHADGKLLRPLLTTITDSF